MPIEIGFGSGVRRKSFTRFPKLLAERFRSDSDPNTGFDGRHYTGNAVVLLDEVRFGLIPTTTTTRPGTITQGTRATQL